MTYEYYPDEIYIDLDLASQDTDCPYFAGDVKKNDQFGAKYVRADKAVPEGWKLVPIEPTRNMIDAFMGGEAGSYIVDSYKAMLSAAPQPPTKGD